MNHNWIDYDNLYNLQTINLCASHFCSIHMIKKHYDTDVFGKKSEKILYYQNRNFYLVIKRYVKLQFVVSYQSSLVNKSSTNIKILTFLCVMCSEANGCYPKILSICIHNESFIAKLSIMMYFMHIIYGSNASDIWEHCACRHIDHHVA